MLKYAMPGAVFLLNSIYGPDEVWDELPRETQEAILEKELKFYVIDAYDVAEKTGMGKRINTIMQTCFFAISGVLPREQAIAEIKKAIKKTYGKRGEAVVQRNYEAVDHTLENLHQVKVPEKLPAESLAVYQSPRKPRNLSGRSSEQSLRVMGIVCRSAFFQMTVHIRHPPQCGKNETYP